MGRELANLRSLLTTNVFTLLDLPVSADLHEIRRRLDEVRLEREMGLSGMGPEQLEVAASVINRPEHLYLHRVSGRWEQDPALGTIATPHDRALYGRSAAALVWLAVATSNEFIETCRSLPDGSQFAWNAIGEVSAGLIDSSAVQSSLDSLFEQLHRVQAHWNVQLVVQQIVDVELQRLAEVGANLGDRLPSTYEAEGLATRAREAIGHAIELQRLVSRNEQASRQLSDAITRVSFAVSTPLHNSANYRQAASVINAALSATHDAATRERLEADLRTVNLVWAHWSLEMAIQRRDTASAIAALESIAGYSSDPEEQAQARRQIAVLKATPLPPSTDPGNAYGLRPISSAPSLSTTNGVGARIYHESWLDREKGLRAGTRFFTLLFYPLIPLGRYCYRRDGNSYQFFGKMSLRAVDFLWLVVACATGAGIWIYSASQSSNDAVADSSSTSSTSSVPSTGDCVNVRQGSSGVSVTVVRCSGSFDARVVGTWSLNGSSYPGSSAMSSMANRNCPSRSASYIYPSPSSFNVGDRTVICLDR